MKLRKKKAFTLTELLVVVVVIGVLSAVVLPKFNKIMETRKTTEAEEIMAAIRTEQERRCALDKRYHSEMAAMSDLVPETTTKYYAYNLTNTGVEAATTSNNKYSYTLVMPSYADGRIACEGADCSKLNKNYPSKDELLSKSDYQNTPVECNAWMDCAGEAERPCGWSGSGKQTRECDHTTGTWSAWSDCSEPPCDPSTEPTMSRPCGCKNEGTQTRVSEPVCDPNTHTWSEPAWGSCSISDTCPCEGDACCGPRGDRPNWVWCGCGNKGTKYRTVRCDTSTGTWYEGPWSACSIEDCSDCERVTGYFDIWTTAQNSNDNIVTQARQRRSCPFNFRESPHNGEIGGRGEEWCKTYVGKGNIKQYGNNGTYTCGYAEYWAGAYQVRGLRCSCQSN